MHLLLYTLLLCGGALAHYGYTARNLFARDESTINDLDGIHCVQECPDAMYFPLDKNCTFRGTHEECKVRYFVECPVCDDTTLYSRVYETCPFTVNDKSYKECKNGTYLRKTTACGTRADCIRGEGEECSISKDLRCAPGLFCQFHKCAGGNSIRNSLQFYYLSPESQSLGNNKNSTFSEFYRRGARTMPYLLFTQHY